MMFPSHLLASLLLGLLLARWLGPFHAREWALIVAFGVVIDLDHLLQLPAYVAATGAAGLHPTAMLQHGSAWQGFMHTPWGLAVVVPAMLLFRSWLPAVFWGLHMVQDFVVARHFVHFGGPVEWLIVLALGALVAGTLHLGRDGAPLWDHALRSFGLAATPSSPLVPAAAALVSTVAPGDPAERGR